MLKLNNKLTNYDAIKSEGKVFVTYDNMEQADEYIINKYIELHNQYSTFGIDQQVFIEKTYNSGVYVPDSPFVKLFTPEMRQYVEKLNKFNRNFMDICYWSTKDRANRKRPTLYTWKYRMTSIRASVEKVIKTKTWFMTFSVYGYILLYIKNRGPVKPQKLVEINPDEYKKICSIYIDLARKNPKYSLLALEMLTGRRMIEHRVESFHAVDFKEISRYLQDLYGVPKQVLAQYTWVKFTGHKKNSKDETKRIGTYYIPLLLRIPFETLQELLLTLDRVVKSENKSRGYEDDLWDERAGGLNIVRQFTQSFVIGGKLKVTFPFKLNKLHNFRAIMAVVLGNELFKHTEKYSEPGQIYTILLGHMTKAERIDYEVIKLLLQPKQPIDIVDHYEQMLEYVEVTEKAKGSRADIEYFKRNTTPEMLKKFTLIDPSFEVDYDAGKFREKAERLKKICSLNTGLTLVTLENVCKQLDKPFEYIYNEACKMYHELNGKGSPITLKKKLTARISE